MSCYLPGFGPFLLSTFAGEINKLLLQHPQADFPTPPAKFLSLGADASGQLGPKKITKMRFLEIKIHHAQNVGKVQISRNNNPPGPIWVNFRQNFPWTAKIQKLLIFRLCSAIYPVWGPCYYPPLVGK